jgi:hypothetical protein
LRSATSSSSKKSYSMSKWSPYRGSGNTGIGDSYLEQVSTRTVNGAQSVPRGLSLPSPTYTTQSFDTSSLAFVSSDVNGAVPAAEGDRNMYYQNNDISSKAPPSYTSAASFSDRRTKSYSTSKWTPGNPRTTGTGDSYLDQL